MGFVPFVASPSETYRRLAAKQTSLSIRERAVINSPVIPVNEPETTK